MNDEWLRHDAKQDRLTLRIHVQPNARSPGIVGLHGGALKIRITAPAADGRANAALLSWLAATLDIPSGSLRLKSGNTSRRKVIEIQRFDKRLLERVMALAE